MQRRHSANQSARMYYILQIVADRANIVQRKKTFRRHITTNSYANTPSANQSARTTYGYFPLSLAGGKFKFARNYSKKKVISFHFTVNSRLAHTSL